MYLLKGQLFVTQTDRKVTETLEQHSALADQIYEMKTRDISSSAYKNHYLNSYNPEQFLAVFASVTFLLSVGFF